MAVVWKANAKIKARRSVVTRLKGRNAIEMKGKPLSEAVAEFLSGEGWYRGADVDRLSEEEAGIIAARLVRRVRAKTALASDKGERLQRAIADGLKKRFTDDTATRDQDVFLKSEDELRQIAGQYLDKDQIPILKEVIAGGLRPLPNEK